MPLDFIKIKEVSKKDWIEVYPDYLVKRSDDLLIRGGVFYAIWDQERGLWSLDEYDVQRLIDKELRAYADTLSGKTTSPIRVKYLSDFSSMSWSNFRTFISKLSDNSKQLDDKVAFSNTVVTKSDFVTRKLSYPLTPAETPAFDRLIRTLYDEENRTKIMWSIGSIIEGSSKKIQKFLVLFGDPGTGKSTMLNIIQELFPGHYTTFDVASLVGTNNQFATAVFGNNPLIGINHDGDMGRVRDNSVLNSIVGHDPMSINAKYQHAYTLAINTMLFIATNKPVTITDAKSGLIRRLIDVRPTGKKIPGEEYDMLVAQLPFELGGIASKCLDVFNELGKGYYNHYKPLDMMLRTDVFYNFIEEHYEAFAEADWITLSRGYALYKEYVDASSLEYKLPKYKFRDEFANYWYEYHKITRIQGVQYRSVYQGFDKSRFQEDEEGVSNVSLRGEWLSLSKQNSSLNDIWADQPAQLAKRGGTPAHRWAGVTTTLSDIDSSKLHYVIPPENHIVIDLDLKDESGNKSLRLNIEAAKKFPMTYAELSQGGAGLHLHYIYDGDTSKLSRVYDVGIDVLLPKGEFSIRRRLTKCNNYTVSTISSGLPLKEKKMISQTSLKSERGLRLMLARNLNKEIHAATKPSVDFIHTILEESYAAGFPYDVSDMQADILDFAADSTNNAAYCIDLALKMQYKSDHEYEEAVALYSPPKDGIITFFDVEVFSNLLLIVLMYDGDDQEPMVMINPSPEEVEQLFSLQLEGYNNRRYDNHILYARSLGYTTEQLFELSQEIIDRKNRDVLFPVAYGLSYADVLDFSTDKKSLKEWEVDLGLEYAELDIPWDKPAPEELWPAIIEYCINDVKATRAVHYHLIEDFHAREILAEISGLTVNHSTQSHTAKIVFGDERNPQKYFLHPDLSEEFPGYKFYEHAAGKADELAYLFDGNPEKVPPGYLSVYRGEVTGEGGYNYGVPGIYRNVLYWDIASMHPSSIEAMNLFGKFTTRYTDLKAVRLAIKHGLFDKARKMYGGILAKYFTDPTKAEKLSKTLKLPLNIVYGLTAAKFPNKFKDERNKDNVVAKRGALFMIELKNAVRERGGDLRIVHIKTDSIKIINYNQDDLDFIMDFGKRYGYDFEEEGVFEKMFLQDDAILVGKWEGGGWTAVGARYAKPYVFKTLFSKEPIVFDDLVEKRAVKKAAIYLEMDEGNGERIFVGRVGRFCPMKPGTGGGTMLRIADEKVGAVTGTKGYHWMTAQMVLELGKEDDIDLSYYDNAVDDALAAIAKHGDPNLLLD